MGDKETLLVDVCCGPCAVPLEELFSNPENIYAKQFDVILYVTNSNVHPFTEYVRRLQGIRHVAKYYKNMLIIDAYNPREWLERMKGLENDPEGGKRCEACYRYRLEKAADYALSHGYKTFTSTITTGPPKDAEVVNRIGKEIAAGKGLQFMELDLKKRGGFLKSVMMSKKLGLYRQNYCGCIFSMSQQKGGKGAKKAGMKTAPRLEKETMA